MPALDNLQGRRFGRLLVVQRAENGRRCRARWHCRCDCGGETIAHAAGLKSGQSQSCGCRNKEIIAATHSTHRMSSANEYRIWLAMHQRCSNPNNSNFHHYGGRGIKVCERWYEFENFYADMGPRPSKKHTVERHDNDADYGPSNCTWETLSVQMRNRRYLKQKQRDPGCPGVVWDKNRAQWSARIKLNGKSINLGRFSVAAHAIAARKEAERVYWG